ncbi:MAG: hypothetical protein ACOCQR_01410 [bacterium]
MGAKKQITEFQCKFCGEDDAWTHVETPKICAKCARKIAQFLIVEKNVKCFDNIVVKA